VWIVNFANAADTMSAEPRAQIDAILASYLELGLFNGSVFVADGVRVVLKKDCGLAIVEWDTPSSFVDEFFTKLDLLFEPWTKLSYSKFSYFRLGILERITGDPYEELLHGRIFDPLAME